MCRFCLEMMIESDRASVAVGWGIFNPQSHVKVGHGFPLPQCASGIAESDEALRHAFARTVASH